MCEISHTHDEFTSPPPSVCMCVSFDVKAIKVWKWAIIMCQGTRGTWWYGAMRFSAVVWWIYWMVKIEVKKRKFIGLSCGCTHMNKLKAMIVRITWTEVGRCIFATYILCLVIFIVAQQCFVYRFKWFLVILFLFAFKGYELVSYLLISYLYLFLKVTLSFSPAN